MPYTRGFNSDFGRLGAEVAKEWPEKDVLRRNGKKTDTLGLALSGGGYRSAIFCYGVMRGLHELGVLPKIDYVSAVSGGSWIATPFAMTERFDWFFKLNEADSNFIEEAFESLLPNPIRIREEAALLRPDNNYLSDLFGRLLARNFLREHGDYSRFRPLHDDTLIRDQDRPFLIVNGTVNFRRPGTFDISQECFEMTRLYCGSRSLGYIDSKDLLADDDPIRIRDTVAISGAAAAHHIPGLECDVLGVGLSREVVNYTRGKIPKADNPPDVDRLDVADGGFYNNLGLESLINRGCGFVILVDAEHDPEDKRGKRSNQKYHGLRTLMARNHIPQPAFPLDVLDRADEGVHYVRGGPKVPDVLYVKLKSSSAFDKVASKRPYNQSSFLRNLFGRGDFSFDPQFSTAKLDYSFTEHRNLSELGAFMVQSNAALFREFVAKSR